MWLTPENFGATHGPTDADIQAITNWLNSQGFAVNKVYSGKTIIEFSGDAGQMQRTFGTEILKYEVSGRSYLASAQNPGTITTNISSIGAYALTAQYLGDAENSGSNSSAIREVITGTTTLEIIESTNNLNHQTNLTINLQ